MPIALIFIGAFLAIAGIKNNAQTLGKTVGEDFRGAGSFWYWIISVIIIGSIGYASDARLISRLFLTLIVLVFALSNEGIYARLVEALQNPTPSTANNQPPPQDGSKQEPVANLNIMDMLFNPNPMTWLSPTGAPAQ